MEGNPDPNFKDDGPKVPDPAIPDRMVSTKRANQPFLAWVFHIFHDISCQQAHVYKIYALFFFQGTKHTATNKQGFTPHGSNAKTPVKLPSHAGIPILPPPSRTQRTRRAYTRSACSDCASFWFTCCWLRCSRENSSRASGSGAMRPMCASRCGSCGRRRRDCFRRVCWQILMGAIPINPFISRCVAFVVYFSFSPPVCVSIVPFCCPGVSWLGAWQGRAQLVQRSRAV